jgi:hypothetical protein
MSSECGQENRQEVAQDSKVVSGPRRKSVRAIRYPAGWVRQHFMNYFLHGLYCAVSCVALDQLPFMASLGAHIRAFSGGREIKESRMLQYVAIVEV